MNRVDEEARSSKRHVLSFHLVKLIYLSWEVSPKGLKSYYLRGNGGRCSSELKNRSLGVSLRSVSVRKMSYVTSTVNSKANVL